MPDQNRHLAYWIILITEPLARTATQGQSLAVTTRSPSAKGTHFDRASLAQSRKQTHGHHTPFCLEKLMIIILSSSSSSSSYQFVKRSQDDVERSRNKINYNYKKGKETCHLVFFFISFSVVYYSQDVTGRIWINHQLTENDDGQRRLYQHQETGSLFYQKIAFTILVVPSIASRLSTRLHLCRKVHTHTLFDRTFSADCRNAIVEIEKKKWGEEKK